MPLREGAGEGKVQPVRRGSLAASARARQGLGATARQVRGEFGVVSGAVARWL
jgi:hypothetical protein